VAVVTTFYTNPLTIVPLYVVAYEYGSLFFPDAAPVTDLTLPVFTGIGAYGPALLAWATDLGKPLVLGLLLLALTLAGTGWAVVRIGWRCHAVSAWRRRIRLRTVA